MRKGLIVFVLVILLIVGAGLIAGCGGGDDRLVRHEIRAVPGMSIELPRSWGKPHQPDPEWPVATTDFFRHGFDENISILAHGPRGRSLDWLARSMTDGMKIEGDGPRYIRLPVGRAWEGRWRDPANNVKGGYLYYDQITFLHGETSGLDGTGPAITLLLRTEDEARRDELRAMFEQAARSIRSRAKAHNLAGG